MINNRMDERVDATGTEVEVMDRESGVEFHGDAKNVSGKGLLFHATMEPPVGADLDVKLGDARGAMQVTRVAPAAGGGFDVAGRLTRR